MLSNLSAHHHVFTADGPVGEQSSVHCHASGPLFPTERTTAIFAATQLTLAAGEWPFRN
jgi:hypothetical protein